ncbi:amidase signature domain-containing protein [Bisporella sp. PMI_857]|nr:amidase signature domain-containing protein [Bisporella sp. PMI_857]
MPAPAGVLEEHRPSYKGWSWLGIREFWYRVSISLLDHTLRFRVTDPQTISSIVSPSEKSGVIGFRPTRGLISSHGIIPVSQEQDVVGSIARTVKDIALILDAVALNCTDIHGIRIGVISDARQQVDKAKLNAFQATLDPLKVAGTMVVEDARLAGVEEYDNILRGMSLSCNEHWPQVYAVLISPAASLTFQNFAAMGGNPVISVPMRLYPEDTKVKRDGQSAFVTVAPGIPSLSLTLSMAKDSMSRLSYPSTLESQAAFGPKI